jgi:hypothetical protein
MDTLHIPKYVPNYFLINGKCGNEINADDSITIKGAEGEKILMRMANIGYLANRIIFPPWLNAQILDSDGRPLPSATVNDTCFMMPGERFTVMLRSDIQATGTATVSYVDMNTGLDVFTNNVPVQINGIFNVKEENRSENSFVVYPNPASDRLFIKWNTPEVVYVAEITDVLGRTLINTLTDDETGINISRLNAGVYNIRLSDRKGNPLGARSFIRID